MNIGVFGARAIPSTYSGYETFLTSLLPELGRRGHQVTMYCRAGWVEQPEYQGVTLVTLPGIENKQLSTLTHGMVASFAARFHHHDVVLAVNVANAPYCAMLRLSGQRVALNTDGQEWLRGKWGNAAKSYFKLCARYAGYSSSALVSDCNEMKRIYQEEFDAPSVVIPYAQTAAPFAGIDADLDQFSVRPNGFVMVAARLNPENNVDRVAEAFSKSQLNCPLLVLGTANYASEVFARLESVASADARIRIVGHVGDRAAFAALQRGARAYVHGHSVGGMNPSLLEAMSAGARILALDTAFNREVLGESGTYFDLSGATRAFDALATESGTISLEYRRRACDRAAASFSLDAVADSYELLLTKVAALPRARDRAGLRTSWDTT
jgi:glycosyltransferase involved in cell wall biosynthesis